MKDSGAAEHAATLNSSHSGGERSGKHWSMVVISSGLLGALVSLAWSWQPSLWSDEVATLRAVRLDWGALVEFVQHKDAVHALYYGLMHVWIGLFGQSEFAVRSLSAVGVGVAAAGLVLLGTRMSDKRLGLLAAAVFVVLPRTTFMGAEARSYAIVAAFAVWAIIALVWCCSQPRRLPWLVYIATIVVASGLFVYSLLLLPVHASYVLFSRKSKPSLLRWCASAVIAIAAASPFLVLVASQKQQISWLADEPSVTVWTVVVEPFFDSSLGTAVVSVALLIVAISITRVRGRFIALPLFPLAVAWTALPLVFLLLANTIDGPLYLARYLSFCAPGAAVLIALALRSFERHWLSVAGVLLIAAVSIPTYVSQRGPYAKNGGSDLAAVATYIHDNSRHGDAIYFSETGPTTLRPRLALYAYPQRFENVSDVGLVEKFNSSGRWTFLDTTAPLQHIGAKLHSHSRVWYLGATRDASCDTGADIGFLHNAGFTLTERTVTNRETICEFVRQP